MSKSTDWESSLWRDTFGKMLDDDNELVCGGQWGLNFSYSQTEGLTEEERKRGWKIGKCKGYAHFKCGSCSKVWTSVKAAVLFRYRLRGARGTVIMRPFGQACCRCKKTFYLPGFSSEEIERALLWVFAKIRKNCYREKEPTDVGGSDNKRGGGKPHRSDLCEACSMRICDEEDDYNSVFSNEERERALLRLFAKIWKNCYRVKEPTDDGGSCNKGGATQAGPVSGLQYGHLQGGG